MENERPRRVGAGFNSRLSADFVWPKNFGNKTRTPGPDRSTSLPAESVHSFRKPSVHEAAGENIKPLSNIERAESIHHSSRIQTVRSGSRHSSILLERKKLALQNEKKRQELEMKRQQIELEALQIKNSMRLLEMEEDLQNAELDSQHCTKMSYASSKMSDESEKDDMQENAISLWVNNIPETVDTIPEETPEPIRIENVHKGNSQTSDIQMLCNTLKDVLVSVKTTNKVPSNSEKMMARQVVEKDFPYFDGNPQDWPLFHKHFTNICSLCDYTDEEIMIKLQRSLKGVAKSSVAGMMLTADVKLVIQTLQTRFGRPDYIIESMISKVRGLPFMKDTNLEKLIVFSTEVNNIVSTMKTLKTTGHLQNPQLIKELLDKLPDSLKLSWGTVIAKKKGIYNLEDFSTWLGDYANAASYVSVPQPFDQTAKQKYSYQRRPERVFSNIERTKNFCYYCGKDSHEDICPQMKSDDIETRWRKVTEKKLCFSCLKRNHQKFKCRRRKACGVLDCKLYHHPLLHKERLESSNVTIEKYSADTDTQIQRLCTVKNEKSVLLRMIPIRLHGPKGILQIYALCDEASTVTLLDSKVAETLGLKGTKEPLCLQWTNDDVSTQNNSQKLDLKISKVDEETKTFFLRGIRTLENLSLPAQTVIMENWKKYPHLKGVPVKSFENEKPVMIIGQDNINLIIPRQLRCGPEKVPVATRCKLGWAVHGNSNHPKYEEHLKAHILHICETSNTDEHLQQLVTQSFSTESFGVLITPHEGLSQENSVATKLMNETVKYVGGRYEIGLLWRNENIQLPESKYRAMQRLKCVEKKCRMNENYAEEYCSKIKYYEEKGYITKLKPEEAEQEFTRTWYLPHFSVTNPNKPNKIRLVFDAASKSHGISLNDVLLAGPDLLRSLVGILWKFRQGRYGFCSDVKEMFHQVLIRKEDRGSQRFLWRDLDHTRDPDVYEMNVMTFGATCSPVCAQFVKNWNAEKFANDPEIKKTIIEKFYVDDFLDSKHTEDEALRTILEVQRIQQLGGFELVNWMTNSKYIQEKLKDKIILATSKNIDDTSLHKVLGLWWNTDEDEFSFRLHLGFDTKEVPTKRKILKSIMSLFDPLGFIACFTIRGKILIQDVWRTGLEWDEELPENLRIVWKKWLEDLQKITTLRIPRCYSLLIPGAKRIEIHTFSDSSEKAFAAVSYLRVVGEHRTDVSLIAAKTRVAPLKPLSIPRLELQGAVMASRLSQSITKELEIPVHQTFFWTDSRCILGWIRGDGRKLKQFVAHRVGEIQERTKCENWRWVPSEQNSADEATRYEDTWSGKVISDNWFHGPTFLKSSESSWPQEDKNSKEDGIQELVETEMKREFQSEICFVTQHIKNALLNINRFSNWLKLLRITAWCLRFIKYSRKVYPDGGKITNLSVSELNEAEKVWIRQSQQESFGEDIQKLKAGKSLERQSRLISLCPEINNEGILVLGGRTDLSTSMKENTKKPFILCPKHDYTKLLIQHYHEKFRHRGVELTLNELRQTFWIINGRSAVKSIFSRCNKCKIERAKPRPPMMGQIPNVRLREEVRPFANVGMDYFGPIIVKIGRRQEKRWGVLFTCLSVRAVHLEISHTLNSDSTIMAILRLAARRGKPEIIFCDNGTNFRGASTEMRKAIVDLDTTAIENSMCSKGIQFRFNPPTAAHMGGVWERLVGSVKRTIGKVLYQQPLKEETLQTYFAETEFIINSRPLTRVSSDPNDFDALTPNHFLIGSWNGQSVSLPDGDCLRREWRRTRNLSNSFWKRWVKEYLPTLTKRNKWNVDQKPIELNDMVILVDDNVPRYQWKLGRIVNIFPGPDNRIRVVDVKTSTGEYRRPVTRICRLELEN